MAESKQLNIAPRLFTIDRSAVAIHDRWHCWPDSLLTGEVMTQLATDPGQLSESVASSLLQAGFLLRSENRLHAALPVYEQLPLDIWRQSLRQGVRLQQSELVVAAERLRTRLSGITRMPAWMEVAHSLLLGFLLWGCGSRLLLELWRTDVMAVIVTAPEQAAGVWHGFVRSNQEHGVSTLIGEPFAQSLVVQELLYLPEVGTALRSLACDDSVLVLHPRAIRILQSLAGLTSDRADESGLHHLAWPALDNADLQGLQAELQLVLSAVFLLQRQLIPDLLQPSLLKEFPGLQQGDLALAAYSLLVRELADLWSQYGLLPPLVAPRLLDLK